MLLNEMLTDKCFRTHVNSNDKKGIIKEIADFFESAHGLDSKVVFEALWNREQKGSIVIWWREREGGLNLGNRPGKSTGVHKFTVALLGHCVHNLSLAHKTHTRAHTQNCDKLQ